MSNNGAQKTLAKRCCSMISVTFGLGLSHVAFDLTGIEIYQLDYRVQLQSIICDDGHIMHYRLPINNQHQPRRTSQSTKTKLRTQKRHDGKIQNKDK